MHFNSDPELDRFRAEIRAFPSSDAARTLGARNRSIYHSEREHIAAWTAILYERGWSAPSWPTEYGGTGWSLVQQSAFAEECYLANLPRTNVQGFQMVGPVIYTFGSEEQKQRYLPPILRGDEFWAQGFSEPGSGSDLASLRTRAELRGGHYIVNGQKIWTSSAQDADFLFCLVRTANTERPQQGISFLLIDRNSPGLTIRPIHSIDDAYGLNEVFFDDVAVPADNLVGEENRGWTYAKFLLGNERSGGAADLPYSKKTLARLVARASAPGPDGRRLIDDLTFGVRLARLEAEVRALDIGVLRLMGGAAGSNPALASVIKIRGSELQQQLSELLLETLGEYGAVLYPDWRTEVVTGGVDEPGGVAADFFYRRAATIWGGANEVQRNIVAKSLMGL